MENCDICGKKPAEVHLTQIIDNITTTLHLCEECARQRGIDISLLEKSESLEKNVNSGEATSSTKKCEKCGFMYEDFKSKGWLGCGNCYSTFNKEIEPLLLELHGSIEYKGRLYSSTKKRDVVNEDLQKEIKMLRAKLMHAIKNEQFEEAASLRDAIQSITQKVRE